MPFPKIYEYTRDFYDACAASAFDEALDVALAASASIPEESYRTSLWIASMHSALGELDEAIRVLLQAVPLGVWWARRVLDSEVHLAPLRTHTRFPELLEAMGRLESGAKSENEIRSVSSQIVQYPRLNQPGIVNLHWRDGNVAEYTQYFKEYCKSAQTDMILPQSHQALGSNGFCWDDTEQSKAQLRAAIRYSKHGVAAIWGASQGAAIGYQLAADTGLPFVGLMPSLSPAVVPEHVDPEPSVVLFAGTRDHHFARVKEFANLLSKRGGRVRLVELDGVGHYLPRDMTEVLLSHLP